MPRFARPDRRGRDSAGHGTDPPGSLANRFAHALAKARALLCGGAHRSARASAGLWYPILFSMGILGFGPGFGLRQLCFPTLVPLAYFRIIRRFCRPFLFPFVYRDCFWFSERKSVRSAVKLGAAQSFGHPRLVRGIISICLFARFARKDASPARSAASRRR